MKVRIDGRGMERFFNIAAQRGITITEIETKETKKARKAGSVGKKEDRVEKIHAAEYSHRQYTQKDECIERNEYEKDNAEMDQKTQNLLDTFGIAEIAEKYPNELSGGQKQRVAVARALSNTPLLILADEPTGNLDSKSSAAVIESFLLAKEKMNATILMVTHDAIAASYADRVVALSDGKIVKELLRTVEPRQFMNEILDFLKVVEVSR